MFNSLINQIIKPKLKYRKISNNYIDLLTQTPEINKQQACFQKNDKFPDKSIWDMAYFQARNKTVIKYLGKVKSKLVLDLGCGIGVDTQLLIKKGAKVVSLDATDKALKTSCQVNNNLHIRADATQLPFKDQVFDLVFGRQILHHVNHDQALKEIRRVLKKNGRAVFVETLKLNPVIAVYRTVNFFKRAPQHPFLPWQLPVTAKKYFSSCQVRFFYTLLPFFYLLMIYFPKLNHWASNIYIEKFSNFDDQLSNKLPWLAWEQVIRLTV